MNAQLTETDGTESLLTMILTMMAFYDEVDYDDGIGLNELINAQLFYTKPNKDFINIDLSRTYLLSIEILNSLGDVLILENL